MMFSVYSYLITRIYTSLISSVIETIIKNSINGKVKLYTFNYY